jgi:hypothetical protein
MLLPYLQAFCGITYKLLGLPILLGTQPNYGPSTRLSQLFMCVILVWLELLLFSVKNKRG